MITAQRIWKAIGKHATRTALKIRALLGSKRDRHCPACRADIVGFFRYGAERAWGCPNCGASPRERLMHALLDSGQLRIPDGAAILHCAPNEASLVVRFRQGAREYVPADFDPSRYPLPDIQKVDLMALGDQARFDIIYASHVMEHVPDDAQVLRNIHAALKPGGEAWLLVPLWNRPSEDGPADLSPRERERRFGQWDHVRQYGPDFVDRIRAAGLRVDLLDAGLFDEAQRHQQALGDVLFQARRPLG
jgi:SAM-dependent methyltransferase